MEDPPPISLALTPDLRHLQVVDPMTDFHHHEFNSVANKTRTSE